MNYHADRRLTRELLVRSLYCSSRCLEQHMLFTICWYGFYFSNAKCTGRVERSWQQDNNTASQTRSDDTYPWMFLWAVMRDISIEGFKQLLHTWIREAKVKSGWGISHNICIAICMLAGYMELEHLWTFNPNTCSVMHICSHQGSYIRV